MSSTRVCQICGKNKHASSMVKIGGRYACAGIFGGSCKSEAQRRFKIRNASNANERYGVMDEENKVALKIFGWMFIPPFVGMLISGFVSSAAQTFGASVEFANNLGMTVSLGALVFFICYVIAVKFGIIKKSEKNTK